MTNAVVLLVGFVSSMMTVASVSSLMIRWRRMLTMIWARWQPGAESMTLAMIFLVSSLAVKIPTFSTSVMYLRQSGDLVNSLEAFFRSASPVAFGG